MQIKYLSYIALAVSAALSQSAMGALVDDQAQAKGLLEDSSLNVHLRNYYFNRDAKQGERDNRDWSQGAIAHYNSGFTQGTVGVGVDAWGQLGLKLDGQSRYAGTGNLPVDRHGHPDRSSASAGASIKMRAGQTQLRYGNMQTEAPVFATSHSRLLPQTATGFSLQSSDLDNLDLDFGHYTATNSGVTTNGRHTIHANNAGVRSGSATFAGATWQLSPEWSSTLYGARLDDVWNQYYFNNNYVLGLSGSDKLEFDANLYRTLDQGHAKAGAINNTAWSMAGTYSFNSAHALTLSYQKIHGNTPFDLIGTGNNRSGEGGSSINLANAAQFSDFNGPNERSWGLTYKLDMAPLGVPGLSFTTRHMRGTGIDGSKTPYNSAYAGLYGENGRHHETNFETRYIVQSGAAKDLSVRLRQAFHRANLDQGEKNVNEVRLILDYPLNLI
ncbi:outer membrane porin protein OprD [Pseudomonas sp. StFLB209]|uniref:OprD family porin n=1 Tax=Pseudomonas sp. StFLB209 TaxID=1028989 RepID=UPI0004F6817C|nr:OprD family porin [Pseudomonas sp. StFLB209]BAP45836.1 outer membrane porin protein OprD [Pseudomonas sp. StFLB209]